MDDRGDMSQQPIQTLDERADVPTLVPATRPDAEVAAGLKQKVTERLTGLCEVIDEAKVRGFKVGFTLGTDWSGRSTITSLTIFKEF